MRWRQWGASLPDGLLFTADTQGAAADVVEGPFFGSFPNCWSERYLRLEEGGRKLDGWMISK